VRRETGARALVVAAALAHLVLVYSLVFGFLNPLFFEASRSHGQAGDFFGIYQAGVNVREGRSMYARVELGDRFTLSVPYYYFYRYPPPTALAFAPVSAWLRPWPAYWLWVALNEIFLMIAAVRVLGLRIGTLWQRATAASLWLFFTPFYLEQFMGQFSFSMGLLIAVMFSSLLRGERGDGALGGRGDPLPRLAMAAWIGSLALKSYTALFAVPLLVRRRWKTLAIGAAGTVLVVAPYYVARPGDLLYFLRINLRPFQEGAISGTFGFHALLKEISLAAFGEAGLRKIALGPADLAVANVPVTLAMVLVLGTALWVTWRSRAPLVEILCLWVLAFFLSYKEIWEYHYVMLLPVLTVLYLRRGSAFPLAVWIALALPTPYALYAGSYHAASGRWDLLPGLVHFASKSLPTSALFVWLALGLRRADRLAAAMPASARVLDIGSRQ
jgi:hypothetical protein